MSATPSDFDLSMFDGPSIIVPKKKKRPNWQLEKRSIIKQPMTAWNFFLEECQNKSRLSFKELCCECSASWQGLTSEEKQPYVNLFIQDKLRFQREMGALTGHDRNRLKDCLAQRRRARSKRPRSQRAWIPYIFFCNKMRPRLMLQHPQMSFTDLGKELGKMWRNLPEADKVEYFQQSADDKLRIENERNS